MPEILTDEYMRVRDQRNDYRRLSQDWHAECEIKIQRIRDLEARIRVLDQRIHRRVEQMVVAWFCSFVIVAGFMAWMVAR